MERNRDGNRRGDAAREVCDEFLDRIGHSERGKLTLKIRTLMERVGFNALQRVRQSSLNEVLAVLAEGGIGHTFPGGTSAYDYVTLFRSEAAAAATSANVADTGDGDHRGLDGAAPTSAQALAKPLALQPHHDPFTFAFDVDDVLDRSRSIDLAGDLVTAVWSCTPVCVLVDAADEFFLFAAGYLSAVMRRRLLMLRSGVTIGLPVAPEILRIEDLKRIAGQASDVGGVRGAFPGFGSVYLIRDQADDMQDDELASFVREAFIPHTYRLRARFATTVGEMEGSRRRASDDEDFPGVVQWMAAFAGTPSLQVFAADGALVDMAGLFTEACRLREVLLNGVTLGPTDPLFRAGFESTEHMALKNIAIRFLRGQFPTDEPIVEEMVGDEDHDVDLGDTEGQDSAQRRARPDVRVGKKVWVEVETLRWIALVGSSPFYELERKLRQKLEAMRSAGEVWLVFPGDVAMLAPAQLSALARNLDTTVGTTKFKVAFADLHRGQLVFIAPLPPPRPRVRLTGASWRETKRPVTDARLTWADVAGYSMLRTRITEQVLAPLRDPQRYARFGLSGANGLLLFGLPGCGKSRIGRVLAGEADIVCRRVGPSDLTSKWIGEGVEKIREVFDWAMKQPSCLLVIDEIDAIAPQRRENGMHSDEKRQVNELLAQLDRIAGKPVVVVGTTNYVTGIDNAIRRSGRFDVKLEVLPPSAADREAIFRYYLSPERLRGVHGLDRIDHRLLAEHTWLFTPADIKSLIDTLLRRAVATAAGDAAPSISEAELLAGVRGHGRSIQRDHAIEWIAEARRLDIDADGLRWLEEEVRRAYPT